jgi:transposase
MGVRTTVSDHPWSVLAPTLAALTPRGPKRRNDRAFFVGVVWILRTGAPWRDMPPMFGKWNTLYQRFRRWAKAERWERMRQVLLPPVEADALLLLDSTIIKAHPHAAGARRVDSEARDGRVKQYRHVATRYDKTATSYGSFAATAALCTRLSGWAA